jgi:UDP-glucose-4-epimerase GalE
MTANVIVTGGAGYVGSHVCLSLAEAGFVPVALDTLERGHRSAVQWGPLVIGSVADAPALRSLFAEYRPTAVVHCAAYTLVGESAEQPQRYFTNNVGGTSELVTAMLDCGVDKLVFSSTSAVYGTPRRQTMDESHPLDPQSPYGHSKAAAEKIIAAAQQSGLRSVMLRYFNAAGADSRSRIGEAHEPETHLIPVILDVAAGRQPALTVYGTDYPTPDGTCIRDYVHVCDVADAHVAALHRLISGGGPLVANLGHGQGFCVRQVIQTVERTTGRKIAQIVGPRRAGDPPSVVADCAVARRELAWNPARSTLDTIVGDAWNWHRRLRGV